MHSLTFLVCFSHLFLSFHGCFSVSAVFLLFLVTFWLLLGYFMLIYSILFIFFFNINFV